MMKKFFAALLVAVLLFSMTLPAFAEDTVEETVEETVAVEEETVLSDTVPDEEDIQEADKQSFIEMLDGMSPEGVDKIKDLIIAGMEGIETEKDTTWDKVKIFTLNHLTEIAWIVFAIVLVFYIFIEYVRYKGLRKSSATMNNNAILISEKGTDAVRACNHTMEEVREDVNSYTKTIEEAAALMKAQAAELEQRNAEYEKLLHEYRIKLEINSRAETLLADALNELLQLSNIPQIKKDAIYGRYTRAKALIESELEDSDGSENEEKAEDIPS